MADPTDRALPDDARCETCRWFREMPGKPEDWQNEWAGACHVRSVQSFPMRSPDDFCGEWRPRPEDRSDPYGEIQRTALKAYYGHAGKNEFTCGTCSMWESYAAADPFYLSGHGRCWLATGGKRKGDPEKHPLTTWDSHCTGWSAKKEAEPGPESRPDIPVEGTG